VGSKRKPLLQKRYRKTPSRPLSIEKSVSIRTREQYSDTAVRGGMCRSEHIRTSGPRLEMAKMKRSGPPIGSHSRFSAL
jgi:hypothetical protein